MALLLTDRQKKAGRQECPYDKSWEGSLPGSDPADLTRALGGYFPKY
jgi:hypothetical protein